MKSVAIAVPIKPGKSKIWVERSRALKRERKTDLEDDFRRYGIHRSASWLQRSPDGDLAILYWDIDDPAKLHERMKAIMTSDDEFYVSVREAMAGVFDVNPDQDRPSTELVVDHTVETPAPD